MRRPEKKEAVVNLGAGPNQVHLIRKAREKGYAVIAVDRDGEAPGFHYSDAALKVSTHETRGVVEKLKEMEGKYRLRGVVARTTGKALFTASAISRAFSLPGIDDTLAMISTEKGGLREFLTGSDIPFPEGRKVFPEETGRPGLPLPVIVKPDFTLSGKKDVYLVTDEGSFSQRLRDAARSSGNGSAEIERFIEGIDVSCMFFCHGGKAEIIAHWDELVGVLKGGAVSGLGISIPSVTSGTDAQRNIDEIVRKFASLFPDAAALLVLSFRIDFMGNAHVIELHADLTGDLILDVLLPASSEGFDPWALILDCATGGKAGCPGRKWSPTTIFYRSRKAGSVQEPDLIQDSSVQRNLEAFQKKVDGSGLDVASPPGHLDWLLGGPREKRGTA